MWYDSSESECGSAKWPYRGSLSHNLVPLSNLGLHLKDLPTPTHLSLILAFIASDRLWLVGVLNRHSAGSAGIWIYNGQGDNLR